MTNKELKNFVTTLAFYANHVNWCFQTKADASIAEAQVDAIQFLIETDCKGVTVERIRSKPDTPCIYSGFVVTRSGRRFWISCLSYGSDKLDYQIRQECIDYLVYMGYDATDFHEL